MDRSGQKDQVTATDCQKKICVTADPSPEFLLFPLGIHKRRRDIPVIVK